MNKTVLGVVILAALTTGARGGGEIPFSKFRLLDEGMSQAEILVRAGEPDRVTVVDNFKRYREIWYYIPTGTTGGWITTIRFDESGKAFRIDRDKILP